MHVSISHEPGSSFVHIWCYPSWERSYSNTNNKSIKSRISCCSKDKREVSLNSENTIFLAILVNLQRTGFDDLSLLLDSDPSLCGPELRPLQPGWRHRGGHAGDGEPRPQGLRGVSPFSDQGHRPPEHEGKCQNERSTYEQFLIAAEGSGSGWVACVCLPSASRGKTNCCHPEGEESSQNGYHRHVRWGITKLSDQTRMNSIHVKYILDLFNFLSRRSICQDLSASQRPENIEKENSREEENTKSCFQRVLCVWSSENR